MLTQIRIVANKLTVPPWPHIAAWCCISVLIFVTICPIGLRPRLGDPNAERFMAFAITGFALLVAYPRRTWTVVLAVALLAALLEVAQLFVPTRDARLMDALVKILGAESGVACGLFIMHWARALAANAVGQVRGPKAAPADREM